MPNYSNSVIYKIVCNNKSIHDMYIGSTCSFISRKAQHKGACNNPTSKKYNYKLYKCIRGLGGWSHWSMIPILEYPCESKMALHIKEREVMDTYNATLNSQSAYNTDEEKAEKLKILKKQWVLDNPDKIKKYKYKKITCECGSKVCRSVMARHRKTTKHFKLMESVVNQI